MRNSNSDVARYSIDDIRSRSRAVLCRDRIPQLVVKKKAGYKANGALTMAIAFFVLRFRVSRALIQAMYMY
jgi:hypothetical protein